MDIYAIHAQGLDALQESMGADCPVFTWFGQPYQCLPSSRAGGKPLGWGGFVPNAVLQLVVLSNQFVGAQPQLNQKLYFQGFMFRITEINSAVNGHQMELICSQETAGA